MKTANKPVVFTAWTTYNTNKIINSTTILIKYDKRLKGIIDSIKDQSKLKVIDKSIVINYEGHTVLEFQQKLILENIPFKMKCFCIPAR